MHAGNGPVLELGCGDGRDTEALVAAGFRVIAIDKSEAALAEARARAPSAELHHQDVRGPFPKGARGTGVVLGSLCLHYFSWPETVEIFLRIREVLAPGGLFLCRLNSTNDHHHGARGYPEIGRNFYQVADTSKRFFDLTEVEALFNAGWRVHAMAEEVIHRYGKPKVIWRVVATAA